MQGYRLMNAYHLYDAVFTITINRYDMRLSHSPRALSDLNGNGQFSKPLLNLNLAHIIPDQLHLMLGVTDRLIKAVIQTAIAYDKHQHQLQRIRYAYKVIDGTLMTKLIAAIR